MTPDYQATSDIRRDSGHMRASLSMNWTPQIAVLIPCLDEAAAIGKVIADFRAALPAALIFTYDNGSSDRTVEIARAAGAIVREEPLRGKGNVMRRMFADVEADIYVPGRWRRHL